MRVVTGGCGLWSETPSAASHSLAMTLGKSPSLANSLGSRDNIYRAVVRTKKEHMKSALLYE